jgi:type II secretory pathway predicted ATPase ExeA
MYLDFYRLKRRPFHVTPDPEFLYLSPGHREALAVIVYGIEQRKGIIEVTGEVGTGKTTILRSYLDQADPERVKTAYVFDPKASFPAVLRNVFRELGIAPASGEIHEMIVQFHMFLIDEYRKDHTVVLLIDEAQNMPVETLENLRLLSNLETSTDKLLQIVLCGQPELDELLGRKELRQLRQRIAVRATIAPLSRAESLNYIRHRLSKASRGGGEIFTDSALARIVRKAAGNPRVINILCDNALITGYGNQEDPVSSGTAREIIADLEGKSSLKYLKWSAAGLFVLLFLTAGYWIYTTTAFTFPGQKTTKVANPILPHTPIDTPVVIRSETPPRLPAGQGIETPVVVRSEHPAPLPAGQGIKTPVVVRSETPPRLPAGQGVASRVPGGSQDQAKKPASAGAKKKAKPVTRSAGNAETQSPPAGEIFEFGDKLDLKRVKQNTGNAPN